MDTYETSKALEMIKEAFPRFNNSNSEIAAWHRLICKFCTIEEFREALDKARLSADTMPGMHSMKMHIQSVKNEAKSKSGKLSPTIDRSEYRPASEMEFCLEHLGTTYVNAQLRTIIKGPQSGQGAMKTVLALCRQKDWLPAYKALMERLVKEAMDVACGTSRRSEGQL